MHEAGTRPAATDRMHAVAEWTFGRQSIFDMIEKVLMGSIELCFETRKKIELRVEDAFRDYDVEVCNVGAVRHQRSYERSKHGIQRNRVDGMELRDWS